MSKREELVKIVSSVDPRSAHEVVDDILDALMEPGEGPMLAGNQQLCDVIQCNCGEEFIWRAILTAIREGK